MAKRRSSKYRVVFLTVALTVVGFATENGHRGMLAPTAVAADLDLAAHAAAVPSRRSGCCSYHDGVCGCSLGRVQCCVVTAR
jgi:hypothetical protein